MIMAALAIAISSDSSYKSVGSPPSQVILFGDIPTVIPSTSMVALETSTIAPVISSAAHVVKTTLVASPTRLCGLVYNSGFDSDSPDEMVIARPLSSSEFPIAPVTAPLEIRRRSAILIRPREVIPFGQPYRTHLNGLYKLLTARKRVGPLPACRLAWRHVSPRSSDHRSSSSSSSSDSLLVHSSGLDAQDQAHSGSLARDVPPRLSLVNSVPSSTLVMGSLTPTCTDLLPPRKRFRDSYSFEASIEEDTKIDPIETKVDIELGIGDRDDVRDHVEIDPRDVRDDTKEYEADTSDGDMVEVGIDPMSALIVEEEIVEPAREDSFDLFGTRDGNVRLFKDIPIDLNDVVRDFYHYMSKVRIDKIVGIETVQRRLEADPLIARGERARMIERIESLRLENFKVRAMLDIERDRVNNL
ncbi:hypothetical protein Tco_0880400 [Tanacetum coccineum]